MIYTIMNILKLNVHDLQGKKKYAVTIEVIMTTNQLVVFYIYPEHFSLYIHPTSLVKIRGP